MRSRKRWAARGVCIACGSDLGLDPHHKAALQAGGRDIRANVVTACRQCHGLFHSVVGFPPPQEPTAFKTDMFLHDARRFLELRPRGGGLMPKWLYSLARKES